MIRPRGKTKQVIVYAGVDPKTGKARYLRESTQAGQKAAERIHRRLVREVETGRTRDERITVAELLERWIKHAGPGLSPTTLRTYRSIIDITLVPELGRVDIEKLRAHAIDELYASMTDEGYAPSTIHQRHAVLHRAFVQAMKWGWVATNPADAASPPPVHPDELEIPTTEQLEAMYGWAVKKKHLDLAVLIRLALATGMRRGELVALRWSAVDLDAGRFTVSHNRVAVKGRVVEKSTKGRQARAFNVDEKTITILRAHRVRELEKAMRVGTPFEISAPVLTGRPGQYWYPDTATARYADAKKAIGVTTRLQDVRHWHVSTLLAAGVPVIEVSRRVGHASTKMTFDIYGHLIRDGLPQSPAAIAALL